MGSLYTLLTQFIPGMPTSLDPYFSLQGPTSGSGTPIGITFGNAGSGSVTLFVCFYDSDCASGYQCNGAAPGTLPGVCSKIGCPAGSTLSGLIWSALLESCIAGISWCSARTCGL